MSDGVVSAVLAAYPAPRRSMARLLGDGPVEARALFHLMAACGIFFVASVPNAIRSAGGIEAVEPVSAAIGAHLFGFLFLAPLIAYAAAGAVHLAARAFGGRGGFAEGRAALFWSLLVAAPVALALAVAGVVAEVAGGQAVLPWFELLGYAGLAFWLWVFAACLAEAEGFVRSGRVAAVVLAAFGLVAALLALLAGGPAAA